MKELPKSSGLSGFGSVKNRASGSRAHPPAVNGLAAAFARPSSGVPLATRPTAAPLSVGGTSGKRDRSCFGVLTGPRPRTVT